MPDPLTDEQMTDLAALAVEATPGPWTADSIGTQYGLAWVIRGMTRWYDMPNSVSFGADGSTACYVAAASPDVVAALVDEVRHLRAIVTAAADAGPWLTGPCHDCPCGTTDTPDLTEHWPDCEWRRCREAADQYATPVEPKETPDV